MTLINKALGSTHPHDSSNAFGGSSNYRTDASQHFNGDLTKWTTFWYSYESAIHNNCDLRDVERFSYLWSLMERSTRDAIAGLTISSANYHEAVDLLGKWFGNKQQIISKHMELLLKVDAVLDQNLVT